MQADEIKNSREAYECIYQNVKMGADSIINLLPKVEDGHLKSDMTQQMAGYEAYASRARTELEKLGEKAEEKGFMTRAMARVGMEMNTMTDTTTSHIAEMMIQGSNMGVVEMQKCINACGREERGDTKAATLAEEVIRFEEKNLERMKQYL